MSVSFPGTKEINVNSKIPNLTGELFCFHIDNFEKAEYLKDFINNLDSHIPSVVFSRTHIENIERRIKEGKSKETPLEQARAFLKKLKTPDDLNRYGEFGEILLSIFAIRVKGAFKLVSKIQNREKIKRNILGRDGIYAYRDSDGDVYFLAGESKTIDDSNDALREAHSDLKKFWESKNDVEHEISLASSHIADEISKENLNVYEEYFISDNQKKTELKYKNIIFIGYSFEIYKKLINKEITFAEFESAIVDDLKRCFKNQEDLIKESRSSIYCFLPFESLSLARNFFADHHNLISN